MPIGWKYTHAHTHNSNTKNHHDHMLVITKSQKNGIPLNEYYIKKKRCITNYCGVPWEYAFGLSESGPQPEKTPIMSQSVLRKARRRRMISRTDLSVWKSTKLPQRAVRAQRNHVSCFVHMFLCRILYLWLLKCRCNLWLAVRKTRSIFYLKL